jgi:DNA-binding NarL/FixJ family response regulator
LRIVTVDELTATTERAPRVLLVEDHELLAETLVLALGRSGFGDVRAAEKLTVDGVVATAEEFKPDVVLLDLYLGEAGLGVPMIAPLARRGAAVLVLTGGHDRYLLAECLEAGATGLFDKAQSFEQLVELIGDAMMGRTVLEPAARDALLAALRNRRAVAKEQMAPFSTLTQREGEVLKLLMDGKSAEAIAAAQFVSLATVRTHVRAILRKLGVNSQLAAVVLAEHAGWKPEGG